MNIKNKDLIQDTDNFNSFLEKIDLKKYRERYVQIKLVEMDLPKDIQALDLLYLYYWDQKTFKDFDAFYKSYLKTYEVELENFRQKITMCKDCFYRGLPARIYRTWASIITQIHAGYIAGSVFGIENIEMSTELDRKNADIRVKYKGNILNYQIKKNTQSREVRKSKTSKRMLEGEHIDLEYKVPPRDIFENPRKKDGEKRKPIIDFEKNKNLKRLDNGFIIFTKEVFLEKKIELDKI